MDAQRSHLSPFSSPVSGAAARILPLAPAAGPRIEVVEPPAGAVLRHYRCTPLGDNDRALTQAEQEFISSFVDPGQGLSILGRAAEEFGVAGQQLRVEFTFDNGHKGGLLFRRL